MPSPFLRPLAVALALLPLLVAPACREKGEETSSTTSSSGGAGGGAGGAGGGGGSPPGEPLVVMNWNAQNFFNDLDDSPAAGETVLTTAQYRAKREAVAAVIQALDPDIAVLQEVENLGVLETMNQMELGGAYPYAALIESDDPRGIDIGALSKIPFDAVVSHKDDQFTKEGTPGPIYRFARDCIELHVTRNARRMVLLGVHYRSKGPPDDEDKRLAEAQRTRAIADGLAAEDPEAALVVLGDFNDLPGSPPFLAVQGSGDGLFDNVVGVLPVSEQWSYNYNGTLELVDHQMANPLLRAMLDATSVRIAHTAAVQAASDHSPIIATYLMR